MVKPHLPFSDGAKHALNEYCPTCHGPFDPAMWDSQGKLLPEAQASPRATVPLSHALNIAITGVKHSEQRYNTCGDWYSDDSSGALWIRVSAELPRREQFLVAIHELVEAFLCECAGVTAEQVDQFDMNNQWFDSWGKEIELGDMSNAPYYRQHQFATGIERLLAAEAQVNWLEYEAHVNQLGR